MNADSLDGRVIAIAGSAAGSGRWSPRGWRRRGRPSPAPTATRTRSTRSAPSSGPEERWDGRAVDLLDEDATRGWCAALVERFGRVDGLVHLVGGWRGGEPLHEAPLEDWDLLHDLLIRTVQHTTRAFHDAAGRRASTAASSSSPPSRRRRRRTPTPPTPPPRPRPRPGPSPSPTASQPGGATANIIVVDAILTPRMREENPGKEFPTFTPAEHIADGDRIPLLGRGRRR